MWAGLSVRLLVYSGSPRAFSPRDDKGGGGVLFVIARRTTVRNSNPSCLGGCGRVCLVDYCLTVDRHGLRPRDDKMVGKRNGQSLCFTLHPSIFTLLSLAFLETNTEAYVEVAAFGGVAVVALSRTQVCPVEVPGTTP